MSRFVDVAFPLVYDHVTEQYFIASDISGGRRNQSPSYWYLTPIEPLETQILQMVADAFGYSTPDDEGGLDDDSA